MSSSRFVHRRSWYTHDKYSVSLLVKLHKTVFILVSEFQASRRLDNDIRLRSSMTGLIIHHSYETSNFVDLRGSFC